MQELPHREWWLFTCFNPTLLPFAEESGHGHEEGWCEGAIYDDTVLVTSVHYIICSCLPHLRPRENLVLCLYPVEGTSFLWVNSFGNVRDKKSCLFLKFLGKRESRIVEFCVKTRNGHSRFGMLRLEFAVEVEAYHIEWSDSEISFGDWRKHSIIPPPSEA